MKTGSVRVLVLVLLASVVRPGLSAVAPLSSLYVESFSALQKQLLLGAQAYQAPQLGALPMLMTAAMPGVGQMDQGKPLAVHVLDLGGGKTGTVIEVYPAAAPAALLQALAGADTALPEPVDGVYALGNGLSVMVSGDRLLLAPKGSDAAACLRAGPLPEMPALPGVLRLSLSPGALVPKLEAFKKTAAAMPKGVNAQGEQNLLALSGVIDFYGQMLSQIDALHLGLIMQEDGILIRTRLAPKPGSDLAAVLASGKAVSAAQLGFIEKGSLISYATGGFVLPERLQQQLIGFYTRMASASPLVTTAQTNELSALMSRSVRQMGAPMAFTGRLGDEGGALLLQGTMAVADPVGYLKEQVELMKAPAFLTVMGQTGMKLPAPTTRLCNGLTVYSWAVERDEEALKEAARAALPPELPAERVEAALEARVASTRLMMRLFGQGYEYAASDKEIVYGMGSPAMIEAALDRVRAPAAASAEAARIEAALRPSGAPHTLGRFSLSAALGLMVEAQPELALALKGAQAAPSEDGVLFASWPYRDERLTALLISASEIKTLAAFAQAAQMQAARKRQGDAAPARPPIPPNF